ncbi:bifunctional DedA family/phosphatase PAP2 family protein [Candidatus Woesearchaeota archaeon]|nr:bifunctional DedA family/phosphatase PAP2 family protein [Candidatus Woesearchaeota archaeon]
MFIINQILGLSLPELHHWGYWILLLFSIFESSPLFGLFIPGQTIAALGGFFARMGILHLTKVVAIIYVGAITGDLIGYSLGRRYGHNFITKYGKYFFFKEEYFEKTKKLMNDHTIKALILGRFNSLTRAFAPFIAGSSQIGFLKFMICNLIGGFLWTVCFVSIGWIFGESYRFAEKYMGRIIIIAFIISILIIYGYKWINKRKHIFAKYQPYTLVLNIASLYVFAKMAEDLIGKEMVTNWDVIVSSKVNLLWNPVLNQIVIFITDLGSTFSIASLSLILLGVLIYKKRWYHSVLFVAGMFGGLLLELLTKSIFHRTRPLNGLIAETGYSFPSAHAMISLIYFSLLLYVFKDDIKNIYLKSIFALGCIMMFLLIGFSRIYLNVHWFSDVIAGFALGLFWITLLILAYKVVVLLRESKRRE